MRYLVLVLLFIACKLNGQIISDFPKDEFGNIYFSKVVKVDSLTKDQLYINSKLFFANVFKSGKDVIQLEDKEAGIIMGKGFTRVESGMRVLNLYFSIKITSKDGRYKAEIYNLEYRSAPSYPYYPQGIVMEIPSMFDSTNYYKTDLEDKIVPKPKFEGYKISTINQINALFDAIEDQMKKQILKDSKGDDW